MRRAVYEPHWIRHTHLFDADEFECSECKAYFRSRSASCPRCGARMRPEKEETDDWEELEELDWMMDDD